MRPVRKVKIPTCCPMRKVLMTIPTTTPILLARSNLINLRAVLNIIFQLNGTFHAAAFQQPGFPGVIEEILDLPHGAALFASGQGVSANSDFFFRSGAA
jgi:hypothetical protein